MWLRLKDGVLTVAEAGILAGPKDVEITEGEWIHVVIQGNKLYINGEEK